MSSPLIPQNLLDRKSSFEEAYFNRIDRVCPTWRKRQMILTGNPDSLSDAELLSHRFENKAKKLTKLITLVGVPAGFYFYTKNPIGTIGVAAASFLFTKLLINTFNFSTCNYSMKFAYQSRSSAIETYNNFNGSYKADQGMFWGMAPDRIKAKFTGTQKEIINLEQARNKNREQL